MTAPAEKLAVLDSAQLDLFQRFIAARTARQRWEEEEDWLREQLLEQIGDATTVINEAGEKLGTRVRARHGFTVDSDLLKRRYPEIYAEVRTKPTYVRDYFRLPSKVPDRSGR